MVFDKNVEISLLYNFYWPLLTDSQKNAVNMYYNQNLSLSEIGQNLSVSRQAVKYSLDNSVKKLYDYEQSLCLMKNYFASKQKLEKIINNCKDKLTAIALIKFLEDL